MINTKDTQGTQINSSTKQFCLTDQRSGPALLKRRNTNNMKKFLVSPAIGEMHLKKTIRAYVTPNRMSTLQKSKNSKYQ